MYIDFVYDVWKLVGGPQRTVCPGPLFGLVGPCSDATLIGRVSKIFRAMLRFGAKFIFVINFKACKYFSNREQHTTDISSQSSRLFISDDSPYYVKMVYKSLQ